MSATTDGVELLARSLGYTRTVLAGVCDADLARPTPCTGWRVSDLLTHLDDALDAFTEAAHGALCLAPATPALLTGAGAGCSVAAIDLKARTLLRTWRDRPVEPVGVVRVGAMLAPAGTLTRVASLELAVHASDLARAVRRPDRPDLREIPDPLARDLWPVAIALLGPEDRAGLFDPPRPVAPGTSTSGRMLAHLGRNPA